jgi:hypothetical protein
VIIVGGSAAMPDDATRIMALARINHLMIRRYMGHLAYYIVTAAGFRRGWPE